MDIEKFKNIEYLKNGNEIQIKSYEILKRNQIMEILKDFQPILTGTIPIEINIESSDLDIICYFETKELKEKLKLILLNQFSKFQNFKIKEYTTTNGDEILFSSFEIDNMEFEIFSQNIPTIKQNAYRHMIIEWIILNEKGEQFKNEIIKLKKQGIKTEPAFAKLLNLNCINPYQELLDLYPTI